MSEPLSRTWPQRLTLAFVLIIAFACFATAGVLAFGQWVLSQRNLIVLDEATEAFQPEIGSVTVRMPGDTTTTTPPLAVGQTTTTTTLPLVEPDAANFLITGADNGACLDQPDPTIGDRSDLGERSDTIMVWRVNPVADQLAVLSFPRDLYVTLPGGRKGRINETYQRNDPSRLINTLQLNFGVPVDHYVQIDFCSFRHLVDAVGGVEVPFLHPARDARSGLVVLDTGCVRLDGDMALAYVRSRRYEYEDPVGSGRWIQDGTSDLGRISRQQDFVRRTISKVIGEGLYSPDVAAALIETNREYLVTDADLTPRLMLEFASTLRNLDPTQITTYQIESVPEETASGSDVQRPLTNNQNMKAILAVFRGEATIASAPEQILGTTTTTPPPATTEPDPTPAATTAPPPTGTTEPDPAPTVTAPPTTLPAVDPIENQLGVSPPRDIVCN